MFIHSQLTQCVSGIIMPIIRRQPVLQANTRHGFIQSVSWQWA